MWKNAIAIYRNVNGGDPNNLLDVLRLARLTKGMQTENDYYAYAAKAHELGDFGEAVSVVDEGIAAGKLKASDPDIAAILKDSKPKVPTPADLAAAEKAARFRPPTSASATVTMPPAITRRPPICIARRSPRAPMPDLPTCGSARRLPAPATRRERLPR